MPRWSLKLNVESSPEKPLQQMPKLKLFWEICLAAALAFLFAWIFEWLRK